MESGLDLLSFQQGITLIFFVVGGGPDRSGPGR